MAQRHIRAALVKRKGTKKAMWVARSGTARAKQGLEGSVYDTHAGHKARNSRTVNAPKGW